MPLQLVNPQTTTVHSVETFNVHYLIPTVHVPSIMAPPEASGPNINLHLDKPIQTNITFKFLVDLPNSRFWPLFIVTYGAIIYTVHCLTR